MVKATGYLRVDFCNYGNVLKSRVNNEEKDIQSKILDKRLVIHDSIYCILYIVLFRFQNLLLLQK